MAKLLGHRQTKGAKTDKPSLMSPRHISTLPAYEVRHVTQFIKHHMTSVIFESKQKLSCVLALVFTLMYPICALADRYGVREALEDGVSSGDAESFKYIAGGAAVGASIGCICCLLYNLTHEKKIAVDGGLVLGGLIGAFVLPFVYIIATR